MRQSAGFRLIVPVLRRKVSSKCEVRSAGPDEERNRNPFIKALRKALTNPFPE